MSLKNKIFGFGAAAVLSLTMVSGAMAAGTEDDTASGTAYLNGAQACTLSLESAGDFGDWIYAGNGKYTKPTDSIVDFDLTLFAKTPGGSCNFLVQFPGLSMTDDAGSHSIGLSNFVGTGAVLGGGNLGSAAALLAGDGVPRSADEGAYEGSLELVSLPDNLPLGDYEGTITVTIDSTQ